MCVSFFIFFWSVHWAWNLQSIVLTVLHFLSHRYFIVLLCVPLNHQHGKPTSKMWSKPITSNCRLWMGHKENMIVFINCYLWFIKWPAFPHCNVLHMELLCTIYSHLECGYDCGIGSLCFQMKILTMCFFLKSRD